MGVVVIARKTHSRKKQETIFNTNKKPRQRREYLTGCLIGGKTFFHLFSLVSLGGCPPPPLTKRTFLNQFNYAKYLRNRIGGRGDFRNSKQRENFHSEHRHQRSKNRRLSIPFGNELSRKLTGRNTTTNRI